MNGKHKTKIGLLILTFLIQNLVTGLGLLIYILVTVSDPASEVGMLALLNVWYIPPVLGFVLIVLNVLDRFISVSLTCLLLPWASILVLSIPWLMAKNYTFIHIGMVLCALVFLTQLYFNTKNVVSVIRGK